MKHADTEALLRREQKKREKARRRRIRGWTAAGFLLVLIWGLVWAFGFGPLRDRSGGDPPPYLQEKLPGERARIQMIDVGQGLGILIRSENEAMLVDGGGGKASSKTVAVLKAEGITRLKYLLVTHYDEDHTGGAIGAFAALGAEAVLGPDYVKDGRNYRSLMRRVEEAGMEVIHPEPGQEFQLGRCRFTILAPLKRYDSSNDNSLVLRLTDGRNSILISGDAEEAAEADLTARWGSRLKSDIYVVGHHGSYTSSSPQLLSLCSPSFLLLSCGKNNEYGHPHPSVMSTLLQSGAALYRTDLQGDIRLVFTEKGISWELPPTQDWRAGSDPAAP
ncbi:MAG: MBL fold metallo-hydrolase [Lachnospiraceae bacterium]|nr:MBL fold metallo-hydrolase [Lachnospiraceae bacterium]